MTTRAEWLARRRETCADGGPRIQASELATILFGEQLPLYLDKIGLGEDQDSLLLRRGRAWEAVVADEYATQTGRPVLDLGAFEIQQHPTIPWLGATLDRVTGRPRQSQPSRFAMNIDVHPFNGSEDGGPVQIKVALGRRQEWEFGPPLSVLIQVQCEIACAGASWGAIAALTNYFAPLQTFDVERDDEFLELALPRVEEFRDRVRRRIPPEPTSSLALPALKRLYGATNGRTLTLGPEASKLVLEWEQAKHAEGEAEEARKTSEAKIRAMLGGATFGRMDDGSLLALTTRKDGVTVLRHELPGKWRS